MSEVVSKIISETLESGVDPLQRNYRGIYDGYDDRPVAYLTETSIFTTATGVITGYEKAIENNETGKKWSISNIAATYRALETLSEKEKKVTFLTAMVTRSFLENDVAECLESLASQGITGENICLIFNEKALANSQKAVEGNAEARRMGYKTAIYGFSWNQSLLSLTTAPVDYIFLAPEVTAFAEDRNKPGVFTALTSLLRSLRTEIVLCGVKNDNVIRDAIAAECFGIIPDETYEGEFDFPKNAVDINTILAEEEID